MSPMAVDMTVLLLRILSTVLALVIGYPVVRWLSVVLRARGKDLPQPPDRHWLAGHIPLVAKYLGQGKHFDSILMMLRPTMGRLFRMNLGLYDFVQVLDADAVKEITVTRNLPKSPTYDSLKPFIGERSMIIAEGATWHKQRQAFNPGFAYAFLKQMVPVFASKTSLMMQKMGRWTDKEPEKVVKMHGELSLLTMDIICQVALAEDFKFQDEGGPPNRIHTLFSELLKIVAYYESRPDKLWTKMLPWVGGKINRLQRELDHMLLEVIERRVKQIGEAARVAATASSSPSASSNKKDILSLAIEAATSSEGAGALDTQDILSQIKSFLFAGHDTTATAMAFCIYELSSNPDVERRVVQEIREVCGDEQAVAAGPTADQLNKMRLLNAVVKESLRMWPPAATARMAGPGSTLQGYDIGRKILYLSQFPMHRDPFYWGPDAGQFRPDRWLDKAYVEKLHPYCYTPFSKGPRDCIGQTLAMLEMKTVLTMFYSRFTFTYAGDKPEEQAYNITTVPMYGVPVRISRRQG